MANPLGEVPSVPANEDHYSSQMEVRGNRYQSTFVDQRMKYADRPLPSRSVSGVRN